jgi:hypothetical protein
MIRLLMLVLIAAGMAAFSYLAWGQTQFGGGPSSGTGYPNGSQPITASATGTTGATSVTLAAGAGVTTYICGFTITSGGTTAALVVNATISNAIGGTLNYSYVFVSSGQGFLGAAFPVCIPASATNTAMVLSVPAGGAATVVALTAWGYRL